METETNIKQFFETLGYQVEKIPTENKETPDFLIWDDTWTYVLELKTKFPSDDEIAARKQILYSGGIHTIHESVDRKRLLSNIIRKASNQLKQHEVENAIRLVWLLCTGHLAEPRMHQFEAALYGSTAIISSRGPSDGYFFYHSDFYRFRETLDGAIVSTETEAKLLLNPLSGRYAQLKESSLPKHLGEAVVDPLALEKQGLAFMVDSDVDRDDKEAVLTYLREKYGIEDMVDLTMNYLSGTMWFQDPESGA